MTVSDLVNLVAITEDWMVEHVSSDFYRVTSPDGQIVFIDNGPGAQDHKAYLAAQKQLKHIGWS